MKLFTAAQYKKLLKNGQASAAAIAKDGRTPDHIPVIKLFTPDAGATWLISELDADGDTMFALCDLGQGEPELGYVSLAELQALRGRMRLPVERDLWFTGSKPLTAYAAEAREKGRIYA